MNEMKYYVIGAMLILIVGVGMGVYPFNIVSESYPDSIITYKNYVTAQVCHADGTCEEPIEVKNTVTNNGINHIRNLLGDINSVANQSWAYIELSTNTMSPAATNSTCPNVVTGNQLGIAYRNNTRQESGNGNFTQEVVFVSTGTQNNIWKVCLSNSSTSASNDLMALANLTAAINLVSGDSLNVTYSIGAVNN